MNNFSGFFLVQVYIVAFLPHSHLYFAVTLINLQSASKHEIVKITSSIIKNLVHVELDLFKQIEQPVFRVETYEQNGGRIKKISNNLHRPCEYKNPNEMDLNFTLLTIILQPITNFAFQCSYPAGHYFIRDYLPGEEIVPLASVTEPHTFVLLKVRLYMDRPPQEVQPEVDEEADSDEEEQEEVDPLMEIAAVALKYNVTKVSFGA